MLWIYLCLLSVPYGYVASSLKLSKICSRRKRNACSRWCDTDYSWCYDNECHCLPGYRSYGGDGDSLELDKAPAVGIIDEDKALRHHIAHFCPDLDAARQCIFKCMKTGKPAFCGKDRVCYCGHRYTPEDDDSQYNTKEAYSQFKDLYQKYFGPNNADDYDVV